MTAADRDTLADELSQQFGYHCVDCMDEVGGWKSVDEWAASLADFVAGRDRRVAAQTLRDAADALYAIGKPAHPGSTVDWLRDRADTTEGTHHD